MREAGPADVAALVPLMLEMERFYAGDGAVDATTADLRLTALFPLPETALLLAALPTGSGPALGFASLFRMWPGKDLDGMWYLKELYVSGCARGSGLGQRLMRAAAGAVIARGDRRLEFTTDSGNAAAQRFYARLGIPVQGKVFYRLEGAGLEGLANDPAQ